MNLKNLLKCKKQLSDNIDEHGIDFIVGKTYYIRSIEDNGVNGIYITAEDGSSVWFENESEVLKYFEIIE